MTLTKMKYWVIGSITILGALTFSTGFQAIFKKMNNPFAIGGAALAGAGLTLLVDDRATKYLGKYRSRKDSQSVIDAIRQQHLRHQPKSVFVDEYFDSQEALVRQVEKITSRLINGWIFSWL
ncbi:MAG: hypothetical protein HC770_01910 [Pseudanabaena sp. CRU_2_10]|nr:hypothetical protein [Pseudanabaena sp. CRU_2_10]